MHARRQVLPPRPRGRHVGARHGEGEERVHWAAANPAAIVPGVRRLLPILAHLLSKG